MNWKKIIVYLIVFFFGIIILSAFFAYFTNFNDPITNSIKKVYPGIIIENKAVSIYNLNSKIQLAKLINPSQPADKIKNQIINNLKLLSLAEKFEVYPEEIFLNRELSYYSKNQESEYNKLIEDLFKGNSELFRKNILIPLTVEAYLRIKYFSDSALSSLEYKEAQSLLYQIQQGKEFESLAKLNSDDLESGQLGGDLGFFTSSEILPELEEQIKNAKFGFVFNEIVISRLGYHIIYPIETAYKDGNKYWHIKHILIKKDGFDEWLKSQLDNISVWLLK